MRAAFVIVIAIVIGSCAPPDPEPAETQATEPAVVRTPAQAVAADSAIETPVRVPARVRARGSDPTPEPAPAPPADSAAETWEWPTC